VANYGVNYRLDYCDFIGRSCRIDILKKDYAGAVIPYSAGAEPLEITFKNDSEDKFNQILGSEAKISILSSDTFSLGTFYTGDETQFLAKYYINGSLEWSGFILPDSANEPFLTAPYESQLQAKDILGTLKTVPFADDLGVAIKKTDSLKNILALCLKKTGLNLDFWTGIDTYENRMPSGVADDPLALTFVDTNRYIDSNGNPYSCYDVLSNICNQFSACIKQSAGAWWIVDITLLAGNSYIARHYDYTGTYLGNTSVSNNKQAGLNKELELVDHDHNFSNILGYKSATTYYQYGYLSNKLVNGDFDLLNPQGSASPFQNWTKVGAVVATYGQKSVTVNGVTKLTSDFFAIVGPQNQSGSLRADPFAVLTTNTSAVSALIGVDQPVPAKCQLVVSFDIILNAPGKDPVFWTAKGWSNGSTAQGGNVMNFTTDWNEGDESKTINFDINYPPSDGTISFGIRGGHFIVSTVPQPSVPIFFNDISIQSSEDQYFKSPIGNVVVVTQGDNYSAVPDVTTLLFGDDTKKDRTSWMRLSDNSPTQTWHRFGKTESLTLQEIVARNILNQHQRTSRLFEGTVMGALHPMDTVDIQLVNSKFFFLAGTFYSKAAKCNVKLAELFTVDLPDVNVSAASFEDFGEFKDKDGKTIGSTTGVSNPGGGSSPIDINQFIQNTTTLQTGATFNVKGGRFDNYMTVPLQAPTAKVPGSLWMGEGVTAGNPGSGGGSSLYSELLDVSLSGLAIGQVPVWNGSKWVNQNISLDLNNYFTKSESDGRFLPLHGTADNSLGWNGYTLDKSAAYEAGVDLIFARTTAIGEARFINSQGMRNFIGASITAQANSVALRDASGYINAGYFNTSASTENPVDSVNRLFGGYNNDGFIRPLASGSVNVFLGMPAGGDTLESVVSRFGNTTRSMSISYDGTANDPYGVMSVTRAANGNNLSYYGMTRAGQVGWGMGIATSNSIIWGTGSALGNGGIISNIIANLSPAGAFTTSVLEATLQFKNYGTGFKSKTPYGMVGNYDIQGNTDMIIWTIGDQWNDFSTMYGLGYSYGNALRGGQHQLTVKLAGSTNISLGMDGVIIAAQMIANTFVSSPVIEAKNNLIMPVGRPATPSAGSIWLA
jgi:hypothetical protein